MGDGRPEQGEDGVPEHLVDVPAERLDVDDQSFEACLDEPLDLLGIESFGHRGVADEVGEQHGDDAALFGGERHRAHRRATRGAEP